MPVCVFLSRPDGVVGWSGVCDCGISGYINQGSKRYKVYCDLTGNSEKIAEMFWKNHVQFAKT